jgi:hypothetical protein
MSQERGSIPSAARPPWRWLALALAAFLLAVVVVALAAGRTAPSQAPAREIPLPVPSVAPFMAQTITAAELATLEQAALSPAGLDTSRWPIYINRKYGFSFQYPEGILIEGTTGLDKTNPEYATYLYLQADSDNSAGRYTRFSLGIRAEKLTEEGDRCIPGPRLPLAQFMSKLREQNIINNEKHKKWNKATVSEVIPLNSGNVQGYKLIFDKLKFENCTSIGFGGVDNNPLEVSRYYEEENVRIRINNIIEKNQPENPLYQVILDTLEFHPVR